MSTQLDLPGAIEAALCSANPKLSRRGFLLSSGAVVVTLSVASVPGGRALAQTRGAGPYADPDFLKLDTWIVIHPDNSATFYVGKTDGGQGTGAVTRVLIESADGNRRWHTVGVHGNVIAASWLALEDAISYGLLGR